MARRTDSDGEVRGIFPGFRQAIGNGVFLEVRREDPVRASVCFISGSPPAGVKIYAAADGQSTPHRREWNQPFALQYDGGRISLVGSEEQLNSFKVRRFKILPPPVAVGGEAEPFKHQERR